MAPDFPAFSAGAAWKDPLQFLPASNNAQNSQAPGSQNGAMNQPESRAPRTVNASDSLDGLYAQYRGGGAPFNGGGGPPAGVPRYAPGPIPPPTSATPQPEPAAPVAPAEGTVDPLVQLANPNAPPGLTPVEPAPKLANIIAMPSKSPDLCLYIIDESAQAGKTYRYRISYKVLNPLFDKPVGRVGKNNQAWIQQFDLAAKPSDYSPQITVPTQTYLFCGQNQGNSKATFPFEVFTWTNGKWLKDIFNVSLGDPIGGLDAGIDYSTGWTYADLRSNRTNTRKFVTLVDNDGNIDIRDIAADANSADYKKASQWVDQGKTGSPTPAFQGGPPSGPYGPPGGGGGPFVPPENQ
jgi:hypothetical protein